MKYFGINVHGIWTRVFGHVYLDCPNKKTLHSQLKPELGGYTGNNPGIISNNGINTGYPTCHGTRVLKCPCPTRPGGS
jgi:hypothetical protein